MAGADHDFHAKDAIKSALSATTMVGTAGFFVAAIENALHKSNVGALSVFTRSGSTIALYGKDLNWAA